MIEEFTDIFVIGRTPQTNLTFERKYSTKPFEVLGDLGPNWTHNWQTRLVNTGDTILNPLSNLDITWINEQGSPTVFIRQPGNTFEAPAGQIVELTEFSDRYEIKKKGGLRLAFSKDHSTIPDGRIIYVEEPHGEKIEVNYNGSGRLESIETDLAGEVSFIYDGENKIIEVKRERDEISYLYSYNGDDQLETVTDYDEHVTTFTYVDDMPGTQAQGLMKEIENPLGHKTRFSYYDDGRVFEEIGKGEAKTVFSYAVYLTDHFTRTRGENGEAVQYNYDDDYRLIEKIFADGSRTKQDWDESDNLVATVDELGYKTLYEYDERGNQTGIKLPENSDFIRTEYDANFDKPNKIIPLVGSETDMTVNTTTGDITAIEREDSTGSIFLNFTYDDFGNALQTTNNYTNYTNITNGNGQLTQVFDTRNTETRTYDSRGRLATREFANGKTLTYSYDNFDRVTQIVNNSGPDVINQYNAIGKLTQRTITDGVKNLITQYEYDEVGRVTAVVDPLSRRTERKYDVPGLGCRYITKGPVEIKDPAGRITKVEYDIKDRPTRTIKPDGSITRREYNDRGDISAVTDSRGNRSAYRYDGNRRLIRRERPTIKTDERGKASSSVEVTTYTYDEGDRLLKEEKLLPSNGNGTELEKLQTIYEYDLLDRVTKVTVKKEGSEEVLDEKTFTYSRQLDTTKILTANNEHVNLGFTFEKTPPFSMTNFEVEATDEGNPLGFIEGDFTVTPDITGQNKIIALNSATMKSNLFDDEGRLTSISASYANKNLNATLTYDSFGRKQTVTYNNGLVGTYSYDDLNRIDEITWNGAGENFSEELTYHTNTGNITQVARELGDFDYSYDNIDQLTEVAYSGALEFTELERELIYDDSGNRKEDSINGEGDIFNNVLVEDDIYKYYTDENGLGNFVQRTHKASKMVELFDYLEDGKIRKYSRLERVPQPQETFSVEYFYDALNRRVAKKISTQSEQYTQTFTYEGMEDKILLAKAGNGRISLYVDGQGIDEHIGHINNQEVKTYVTDHLGTVINGEAVGAAKITGSFGETLQINPITKNSDPAMYGFTGRTLDRESNLYYLRARSYDPTTGRFMSKDPIDIQGGDENLYRYALNKANLLSDPTGKNPYIAIPLGILGLSVGALVKQIISGDGFGGNSLNVGADHPPLPPEPGSGVLLRDDPFTSKEEVKIPLKLECP